MKKDKIIYAVLALIAIGAIIVIAVMGLNENTSFLKHKQLQINIGKSFENEDIKQIAKEVFENEEIIVQKVELYEEIVAITVKDATDEQLEQLNTKINEKYGLENTVKDSITVYEIPKIKISQVITPYILPTIISLAIMVIYALLRYRRIAPLEVIGKILGLNIVAEVLFYSIIAIIRIPFNNAIIPASLAVYAMVSILVFNNLESKRNRIIETENKK